MRFTWKDMAAAILVATIVAPYVGHLVWGTMLFAQDARGMATTGLVLGLVAAMLAGCAAFDPGPLHRTALATGVTAFVAGLVAAWTEYELVLATFVLAIVVTWALGTLIHTGAEAGRRPPRHVREHV